MTASGCRPPEGVPAHRRVFRGRKVENPQEPGLPGNPRHLGRGVAGGGTRQSRGQTPEFQNTAPQSATPICWHSPNLGFFCEPPTPPGSTTTSEMLQCANPDQREQDEKPLFPSRRHIKVRKTRPRIPSGCPRTAPFQRPQRRRLVLQRLQLSWSQNATLRRSVFTRGPPLGRPFLCAAGCACDLSPDGTALSFDFETG